MKAAGNIEFELVEKSPDRVVSEMPVQPGILNPIGLGHAGAMLWFADVTATVVVLGAPTVDQDPTGFPLAINLNANFVGNQPDGKLIAESVFVRRGKTVSVVRTKVTGSEGRLLADVTTNHVLAR